MWSDTGLFELYCLVAHPQFCQIIIWPSRVGQTGEHPKSTQPGSRNRWDTLYKFVVTSPINILCISRFQFQRIDRHGSVVVSVDASMKELSDKQNRNETPESTLALDDVEMEGSLSSGDVEEDYIDEDNEEVKNAAPSDEEWEWPAEQTEKTSANQKTILQKEDFALSTIKSEFWSYFQVKRDVEGRKFALCTKCPEDKSSTFVLDSDSYASMESEAHKIEEAEASAAPGSIPSAELLSVMLDRLEALLPKEDAIMYASRVKRVDWTEVAFEGMDASQCKKWWHYIQERIRRYRIMAELVGDARTWVSQPWTSFYKSKDNNRHPDMPKKQPSTYLLFLSETRGRGLETNPKMQMSEVTKVCSEEWAKLSGQRRMEYKARCEEMRKEYVTKLGQFYRDNPHLRPIRAEKHKKGPATVAAASGPSEPILTRAKPTSQSACKLWNHLKDVHFIERQIQPSPQSQLELTEDSTDSNSRLSQVEHEPFKNTTDSSSRLPPKKAKLPKLPKSKRTISGPCPICNKELKTKTHGAMQSHIRNSHSKGLYRCQLCSDLKHFPVEIAEHVLSHHPGTVCVKCKSCNQMINFGGNPHQFEDHTRG